ncbi:MarR family winged helix-turn-helix transcriptional regulator [Actinomycetospora lemnae]|uniref:MarR family winged helix-turn-helix transcriptional regulator n=1 Tax=Actinomycetospora lemnae TaxID=3019891 RepID=A0ABT5SZT3_9PSEU|nr:MarR family winged helix-turn-helix transcriptional regulator [Actinomycetospora sp. DW7H6]MDD7968378.1 MarR family winged helix-turn-helix transcriptional regulator [Actinomycetospora sp. DW7H6]
MPASAGGSTGEGDEALRLLSLVERTLTGRLEEALRRCGSSLDQWRILSLLAERGGCPMNVVADHVLLLAPKLSKLVDRMVSANLILRRRDHEDRRRVLIVVSPRGRQALAEWDAATAEVRGQFRAVLGPDAELFDALLRRLQEGLTPARLGELEAPA